MRTPRKYTVERSEQILGVACVHGMHHDPEGYCKVCAKRASAWTPRKGGRAHASYHSLAALQIERDHRPTQRPTKVGTGHYPKFTLELAQAINGWPCPEAHDYIRRDGYCRRCAQAASQRIRKERYLERFEQHDLTAP